MLKNAVATVAVLGVLASATAACIFDKGGDYKGGGRKSQGFEEIDTDANAPPSEEEDQPGSAIPGQDSGSQTQDTGQGGAG